MSCGQRWSEEDLIAIYNFAKVVGGAQMSFLIDTVAIHIPWDTLAVRPADYHAAARINAHLPWVKVALLTAQYFPPDGKTIAGPYGKSYGNLLGKTEWDRLQKASSCCSSAQPGRKPTGFSANASTALEQTENFLSYLVDEYMKPNKVPAERLAVEIPAAFARTARALLLARDLDKDEIGLEKVETKLRQMLEPGPFPDRFTTVTTPEKVAKKTKPDNAAAIVPDDLPALNFAEGSVVQDASVLARAKNLAVGCRVQAVRSVRGIKKGGRAHSRAWPRMRWCSGTRAPWPMARKASRRN